MPSTTSSGTPGASAIRLPCAGSKPSSSGWSRTGSAAALSPEAEQEIERLPHDVKLWLERYSLSPVEALFRPNKHEIWLHFCLAQRFQDKCAILLRRVAPVRAAVRSTGVARPFPWVASRFFRHARALFPTVLGTRQVVVAARRTGRGVPAIPCGFGALLPGNVRLLPAL